MRLFQKIVGVVAIFFLGAGVGWIAHQSEPDRKGALPVDGRSNQGKSNGAGSERTTSGSGLGDASVAEEFETAVTTMRKVMLLDPPNFAATLEGLMREGLTAQETMQQSAMLAMASTEQAVAFYRHHKEKSGLGAYEETKEWRNFLLIMGQRDAKGFLDLLGTNFPKGSEASLSSIMHGWTITDPEAAVAWFNELPGDHAAQDMGLRGIMYGLAQNDPKIAIEVFNSLDPEDVNKVSINPFAISLIRNHGFGAIDDWLATDPSQELAELVISEGNHGSMRRPPEEFVPWAAGKLERFPSLVSGFNEMSKRWVRQNPEGSIKWLEEQALANTTSNSGLTMIARQLYKNGHAAPVDEWLEKNPDAVGSPVIKQARDSVIGE